MNQPLPKLKIVSLKKVLLHEEVDPQRLKKLLRRIKKEKVLHNPPVAVRLENKDLFVVLDGANRTSALKRLGLKDILVQVVDYRQNRVQLETWNHLVYGLDPQEIEQEILNHLDLRLREKFVIKEKTPAGIQK